MTDFNSKIVVETEGVDDFVKGLQRAEAEIRIIEAELRKVGIPEDKLRAQATAFRNKMIADVKQVEAARVASERRVRAEQAKTIAEQQNRIKSTLSSARGVGREALGVFIGGGLGEVFSNVVNGLNSVLEANKDTDKELGQLDKSLTKLKVGFTNIALTVLRFVAGPMRALINGAEVVAETLFGISFEAEKASVGVQKLQTAFNSEIETLKRGNISNEARVQLIKDINEEYKDYLPNLLDENATLEEITAAQNAANNAFERKILLLASEEQSIELAKRRLDILKEEIVLERQLLDAQERVAKFEGSSEAAFQDAARVAGIGVNLAKSRIAANKESLRILKQEEDVLNSVISKAGINVKTDFVGLDSKDDKVVEAIRTGKAEVTIETIIKGQASRTENVFDDIESDIQKALANNEIVRAKELVEELKSVRDAYEDTVEVLDQAKKTQVELDREIIASQQSVKDLEETYTGLEGVLEKIFTKDAANSILTEQFNTKALFAGLDSDTADELTKEFTDQIQGNLFRVFETPGLNNAQADALFTAVANRSKTFVDLIKNLAEEGITSPLLETIIGDKEAAEANLADLTKKADDNAKLIANQGIETAKKQQELDEAVLKSQEAIQKKSAEISANISKTAGELFQKNALLLTELGESDLLAKFLAKEAEFIALNEVAQAEIEKTEQNLAASAGDAPLQRKFQQLLDQQTEALVNTKKLQQKELEDLGIKFAEEELAAFNKRFKNEKDALEQQLRQETMDLRDAEAEREAERARFNQRAERDEREFNDDEIAIIEKHTQTILDLEDKRVATEKKLRVGATIEALNDIEERGGDAEVLLKKFNLDERQIIYNHIQKILDITEKGSIDIKEGKKKGFLSAEESQELLNTSVNAFQDVFSAYLSYQDAISEAAINRIQEQLDFINAEISNTTSNIDSLEADLEGKREGRREALLRGIEIEKAREEALVQRKIDQEKKLEEEEKRQSERRKEAAIAQALINAAVAVTGTWAGYASFGPAGPALAAIQTAAIAATTTFEIATIEAQTFADGGMLNGASHAQGGIPFTLNGVPGFEAEGGEAIINKRSVQMYKPLLSAINEAGGGKKFQQGAVLGANFNSINESIGGISQSQIMEMINKPIYVDVNDIGNVAGRQVRVTERSQIG